MQEGAAAVAAAERQSDSADADKESATGPNGQESSTSILQNPAIAKLGTSLQVHSFT